MALSTTLYAIFRQNLEARLAELGWTQRDLAEQMGCTQSFVSQLIRGYRNPGFETLQAVADALDVTPAELISEKCAN